MCVSCRVYWFIWFAYFLVWFVCCLFCACYFVDCVNFVLAVLLPCGFRMYYDCLLALVLGLVDLLWFVAGFGALLLAGVGTGLRCLFVNSVVFDYLIICRLVGSLALGYRLWLCIVLLVLFLLFWILLWLGCDWLF